MNRRRSRRQGKVTILPTAPYKKPRFGNRLSQHIFIALLFLPPSFLLFQQLAQHDFYQTLHAPLSNTTALQRRAIGPLPLQQEDDSAPLATRSAILSSSKIVNASIDTVLICHYSNPCCITALTTGLRSLVRQTIIPTSLVLLHSCILPSEKRLLHTSARDTLNGNDRSIASLELYHKITDFYCPMDSQVRYDQCLLNYLSSQPGINQFRLLLSHRDVLEPTAVEKMWMYLNFRPTISSVRSLSFEERSLRISIEKLDPMLVKQLLPEWNHTAMKAIAAVPMMYRDDMFERQKGYEHGPNETSAWEPLVKILSKGRLLREALYTTIHSRTGVHDLTYHQSMLALQHAKKSKLDVPPHLYSDLAFYKWSSRNEEEDVYNESFRTVDHLELGPLAIGTVDKLAEKRVMFLMPWINMGGSEKAMLDLANRMLSMSWAVSFVFTMPNWEEDTLGELIYANAWLQKALSLTSDVINLVGLAPNHLTSKAFRYVLESRKPDIVFLSNSRWGYGHAPLVRAVLPNAVIADYNHMIHTSWFGGGLPRYGANNSKYFDVHFTASNDVASSMEKWINPKLLVHNPRKVKPCYIGTDPTVFYADSERPAMRTSQRQRYNISENVTVVLFTGRFVIGKGTDVMVELVKKCNGDVNLIGKLFFLFVGEGTDRRQLELLKESNKNVLILPPGKGLHEMRKYYAMSDILLLPSVNEGIALVLYEAMAAELLVMTTNVGGQRELVTPDSGILLPNASTVSEMTCLVIEFLREVLGNREKYEKMRVTARDKVRRQFTTSNFCDCVIEGLQAVKRGYDFNFESMEGKFRELSRMLAEEAEIERGDGLWKRGLVSRTLHHALTIGIKTYVCDEQTISQVRSLVRSIRANYPQVRVLLGNDGPTSLRDEDFVKNDEHTEEVVLRRDSGISIGRNTLVNMTTTKYFLLLDDDHVVDDLTNLVKVVLALEKGSYDIVGLRIRNLPGIDELERIGINIPRYVARIQRFEKRQLILCLWNENEGPSVYGMEDAVRVDVLHNVFVGKTDVLRRHSWRDELQVNEHMTFFLDAWRAGVKVGYLPSEFVHHRPRRYSKCYYQVRFREDRFAKLLDYDDRFLYDIRCGEEFPNVVRTHLGREFGKSLMY